MEQTDETMDMLEFMQRPAFCVKDGRIVRVNAAAKGYFLETGTEIVTLLATGREEYADFSGGCLYLTLTISGHAVGASVNRVDGRDVFVLEVEDRTVLRAMALAAQWLRMPLTGMMAVADRMFSAVCELGEDSLRKQAAQMNRCMYQAHRTVCNMADAYRYLDTAFRPVSRDVAALMEEIFRQAADMAAEVGQTLEFQGLPGPVYSLVDGERLERAVYNILSNAMKFSPPGSTIRASLTRKKSRLYLTIRDSGCGVPEDLRSSVFSRFSRAPSLEDGRFGIGLGMLLVREIAAVHGGVVLMEREKPSGTRITMTLEIRKGGSAPLCEPVLRPDYTGGRTHGLVELSDVLPPELYDDDNLH